MIKLQHTLAVACLLALGACGGDQDTGEGRLVHSAGQAGSQSESHPLQSPREIVSQNGELRATFTASGATVEVAGKSFHTIAYDNDFMPPLLRVKPGDTIFLSLNNQADEPTNEHYHGLNVSPRINPDATVSDDVFIQADPGTQVNYKIAIPTGHNPGLYWYHAHLHGQAERQVMGGLSGGLIIEGVLDPFPELAGIREQVLLLKDVQITAQGTLPQDIDPGADTNRTINGQTRPSIEIGREELQFWRFANIGADMYYRLALDGHVFYELARDGNRHNQLIEMQEILLPPGARSEVFVRGGAPGRYTLHTLDVNTGPDGDDYAAAELASVVVVTGGPAQRHMELPQTLPAVEDFRTLPVARRRTITFSEDTKSNAFFMDSGAGRAQFDPNRVDATITSGTIEEWVVSNATAEQHVFHIHQTDFQVVEINGSPQRFVGHQDHVNVPFQPEGGLPGAVKILIDFRNPDIVGKFVYHCHILEHEDGGMMSVAEVVEPPGGSSALDLQPPSSLAFDANVARNTLIGFQRGSFCKTKLPGPRGFAARARDSAAFRVERVMQSAQ